MSSNATLTLSELDQLIEAAGLPVRAETLEDAWDLISTSDQPAPPIRHVVLLVTMRARPELGPQLEEAALEFVDATSRLDGALGSTIHQSSSDPLTWFLIERFSGQEAFARHMASDYFLRFQFIQRSLLAEPVQAFFLAGSRP